MLKNGNQPYSQYVLLAVTIEQLMDKAINFYREAYRRALYRLVMDCETRKQDIEGGIGAYIDSGDGRWNGFGFPCFENPIKC